MRHVLRGLGRIRRPKDSFSAASQKLAFSIVGESWAFSGLAGGGHAWSSCSIPSSSPRGGLGCSPQLPTHLARLWLRSRSWKPPSVALPFEQPSTRNKCYPAGRSGKPTDAKSRLVLDLALSYSPLVKKKNKMAEKVQYLQRSICRSPRESKFTKPPEHLRFYLHYASRRPDGYFGAVKLPRVNSGVCLSRLFVLFPSLLFRHALVYAGSAEQIGPSRQQRAIPGCLSCRPLRQALREGFPVLIPGTHGSMLGSRSGVCGRCEHPRWARASVKSDQRFLALIFMHKYGAAKWLLLVVLWWRESREEEKNSRPHWGCSSGHRD